MAVSDGALLPVLIADIEAMAASTKRQQPDALGRQYGYYTLHCPKDCGWWMRVEYQAHDDTPHPYSWPFTIDTADGRVWTDRERFKLASETAERLVEMAVEHRSKCSGRGDRITAGESARSVAWQEAWRQAEEVITGR